MYTSNANWLNIPNVEDDEVASLLMLNNIKIQSVCVFCQKGQEEKKRKFKTRKYKAIK